MAKHELDVKFVNRTQRIAVLTDNRIVPVTHWFDNRGELCAPVRAVSCVAGSDETKWFCIDLTQFVYATVH